MSNRLFVYSLSSRTWEPMDDHEGAAPEGRMNHSLVAYGSRTPTTRAGLACATSGSWIRPRWPGPRLPSTALTSHTSAGALGPLAPHLRHKGPKWGCEKWGGDGFRAPSCGGRVAHGAVAPWLAEG
eukprot:scaffold4475_cov114-Isochrysis_galbana.AAC.10